MPKGGENASRKLAEGNHEAVFVACDVGDRLAVRNLISETLSSFGTIDILINNAAMLDSAPFLELEEEEFDAVLKTNLKGPFLLGQAVGRQMVDQVDAGKQAGVIVNMSSVNAIFALPDHVAYTVAKGGLAQLTKAMALALAGKGIRVNAIGPGSIMTEMLEEVASDAGIVNRILSRTPLGRFGEPSEVAAIAAFLASDEASYITGTTIYADGGRLALNYTVDVAGKG
ncbi:MAG: SDR family NAD(P)-dependent oxidoreductase [Alphaproteobacteria bacterium]